MKKLVMIVALGLSMAGSVSVFPAEPACSDSKDFCNCFANAAIDNCYKYFDQGSAFCMYNTKPGTPLEPIMNLFNPQEGQQIAKRGSIANFCSQYVAPQSGGNITVDNCENDNGKVFSDAGVYNGTCDGKWGVRAAPTAR